MGVASEDVPVEDGPPSARAALDVLDWRRRVFAMYEAARAAAAGDPAGAWARWRRERDELFASHPQSPIPDAGRSAFRGLPYFEHEPAFRVTADLDPAPSVVLEAATSTGEAMRFVRIGACSFELGGSPSRLDVYWLPSYGGGLFVPFRDATSGGQTYGAGRYLLDTIKGADLGTDDRGRLVLDFNFAYHPSCVYDPRWTCPLAPPTNRLDAAVRAGERLS